MTTWHGYEQDDNAHERFPWWASVGSFAWERCDGRAIRPHPLGWSVTGPHDALYPDGGPCRYDFERCAYTGPSQPVDIIEMIDREHPLPPPEPRCGQVWVDPETGDSLMVVGVGTNDRGERLVYLGCRTIIVIGEHPWPPAKPDGTNVWACVDKGAPWADTSEVADE